VHVGRWFTIFGWAIFLLAVLPTRRALAALAERATTSPVLAPATSLVRWTGEWPVGVRRALLGTALLVAAAVFTAAGVAARGLDADGSYNAGLKLYNASKLADAIPLFQQAQELSPLSNTAIHSTYFEGISWFRQDQWATAEKVFQRLVDRFPEGPSAPESLYHVGLCKARLGDMPGAIATWQETQQRFPATPWAKYAGERLAEQKK
jgi:TolA-binding protein